MMAMAMIQGAVLTAGSGQAGGGREGGKREGERDTEGIRNMYINSQKSKGTAVIHDFAFIVLTSQELDVQVKEGVSIRSQWVWILIGSDKVSEGAYSHQTFTAHRLSTCSSTKSE